VDAILDPNGFAAVWDDLKLVNPKLVGEPPTFDVDELDTVNGFVAVKLVAF
jgi:hypothetical protein